METATVNPSHHQSYATLSVVELHRQNHRFANTGGVSKHCADRGLIPAFMDVHTGISYPARFADGRLAPMHLLEGLPEELVHSRTCQGRVHRLKPTVVAGFLRGSRFFTREQAARAVRLAERIQQQRRHTHSASAKV